MRPIRWPSTSPLTTVRFNPERPNAPLRDCLAYLTLYYEDPTTQSEFTEQIVQNVTEVEPGHQCYKIGSLPSSTTAGTNATIQLTYWADYEGENGGKNETFYACADIVRQIHPIPTRNIIT